MLHLSNINKTYSLRGEIEIPVLNNLSLELNLGDTLVIFGANGCGKSTLLNIINGRDKNYSGELIFMNKDIKLLPFHKKSKNIITIHQNRGIDLPSSLTLLEVYSLLKKTLFDRRISANAVKDELGNKLQQFKIGMEKLMYRQVNSLSGGEYQIFNLLLAEERIVPNHPCILLLDEHTAHLDPKISQIVINQTSKIASLSNVISIIISHSIEQALLLSNKFGIFHKGALEFVTTCKADVLRERIYAAASL